MDTLFDLPPAQPVCTLKAESGALLIWTPYHGGFVQELKVAIPYTSRAWDKERKAWRVDAGHGTTLKRLVFKYFHEDIGLPAASTPARVEQRLLEVHYIGACKDRGSERSAFGMLQDGEWGVIFPEQVLRDWFESGPAPINDTSLYGILGANLVATAEELKTAYRRMAKQWHPDICTEPDATQRFQRINHAWEILSNERARGRYDAGLRLEASLRGGQPSTPGNELVYRPPLRCGFILVNGTEVLTRFQVKKILAWEDILNERGQTLVTSFDLQSKQVIKKWS